MTRLSPARVTGIIIVSLFTIGAFIPLFLVEPMAVVAMIVTVLVVTLLVFGIALISDDEWPWE